MSMELFSFLWTSHNPISKFILEGVLSKAEIHSGICGFTTVVEATMEGKLCNLAIRSDCKEIQKLSQDLKQVHPLQEISFGRSIPRTIQLSMQHCPHAACPVPVGIIKAVEVEANLALPADVSIKLSADRMRSADGERMEDTTSAELMLEATEPSLLIIEERKRKDIVVGVPHHAPAGTPKLPCPEHPAADENAGFLGRYIAEKLECCSIIACNYPVDVNKSFRTDYTVQIENWNPKVLIEIHGHDGKKAKSDIEISSGSFHTDRFSKDLSDRLHSLLSAVKELKSLSICGEHSKLYFKASDTVTISNGRWMSYHIELPPVLRKPSKDKVGKPPDLGYQFCDFLVDTLRRIYVN